MLPIQYRIVFAEDNLSIANVVLNSLSHKGYQVFHYPSGKGVMEGIWEHRPDLIILDVFLPFKDGFSILKEIKESRDISKIPVIFLTSSPDENLVIEAKQLGVSDFILKPFTINDLNQKIRRILEPAAASEGD